MSEEPRPLSYHEIVKAAWNLVAEGARSYVEDALDEDGEFRRDDFARIRKEALRIAEAIGEGDVGWVA